MGECENGLPLVGEGQYVWVGASERNRDSVSKWEGKCKSMSGWLLVRERERV